MTWVLRIVTMRDDVEERRFRDKRELGAFLRTADLSDVLFMVLYDERLNRFENPQPLEAIA